MATTPFSASSRTVAPALSSTVRASSRMISSSSTIRTVIDPSSPVSAMAAMLLGRDRCRCTRTDGCASRELDHEARLVVRCPLGPDPAAVGLDDLAGDVEAETGARDRAVATAHELLEDPLHLVRVDPAS